MASTKSGDNGGFYIIIWTSGIFMLRMNGTSNTYIFRVFGQISGTLWNTGQSLVMRVDGDAKHHVNITGGPLAYRYQFEEIYIHYGAENHQGSEHRIHGHAFPAEVRAKLITATSFADRHLKHDRVWSFC
jgi:hypothetical protein